MDRNRIQLESLMLLFAKIDNEANTVGNDDFTIFDGRKLSHNSLMVWKDIIISNIWKMHRCSCRGNGFELPERPMRAIVMDELIVKLREDGECPFGDSDALADANAIEAWRAAEALSRVG